MRKIAWNRVGPLLALVLVIAPFVAQGAEEPPVCPAAVPVLDAESYGCELPETATIDELVQGAEAVGLIRSAPRGLDPLDEPEGWTAGEVTAELLEDDGLWLDTHGDLLYVEEIPAPVSGSDTTGQRITGLEATVRTTPLATRIDPAAAFDLHSRPAASRSIYLDFTGHTTTGTGWNSIGGRTIVSAPFDTDGKPSTFSESERSVVIAVWERVAEDYAPFDVDVTTVDPGLAALTRSSEGDESYGIRVVVSPTNWYGSGIGGVAYLGSMSSDTDVPAFVFASSLQNLASYIGEAAAHEVGHTVGLRHDGTTSSGYYSGHGDWAPIMGVGFDAGLVQWSKGEYEGANNTEDDLTLAALHLPPVRDDHGDDPSTASLLQADVSRTGVVATPTDVDAFTLTVPAGRLSVSVSGAGEVSDLDVGVTLLDADGSTIHTVAPTGTRNATLDQVVPAGRYTVLVDGVGQGDPRTGWSDYGSLGWYRIEASVRSEGVAPVARYSANRAAYARRSVTFDARSSVDPDGGALRSYRWTIDGATVTSASTPVVSTSWSRSGSYRVRLTVVDDEGVSSTRTSIVTVARNRRITVRPITIHATDDAVRVGVTVVDGRERPVASSRVRVRWSGAADGEASGRTGTDGTVELVAGPTTRRGTVTATVVAVRAPLGYRWDGRSTSAVRSL